MPVRTVTLQAGPCSPTMLLDLTRIRQAETDIERRFEPTEFEGRDHPFRITSPVELRMRVQKDGERYRLTGRVETELDIACSRCLDPYPMSLDASFDVRYLPLTDTAAHEDTEVEDDDLVAVFYRDEQIDLGQLIEEQVYLTLPMKPLCAPDCKGLCPECGTNLNQQTCACEPRWEDPRLAVLKQVIVERKPQDT